MKMVGKPYFTIHFCTFIHIFLTVEFLNSFFFFAKDPVRYVGSKSGEHEHDPLEFPKMQPMIKSGSILIWINTSGF